MSRAQDLFDLLKDDPSPHALCPDRPHQLLAACEASFILVDNAFALRTTVKDVGAWTAWDEYCNTMGRSPWRSNPDPQSDFRGFLREIVLLSNALLYLMKTRRPRSNKDAVIRSASAMAILYAAQRVHSRNHLSMVPQRFGTFLVNCMRHIVDQEEQKWTKEKRAAIPVFDEWCLRREAHGADRSGCGA